MKWLFIPLLLFPIVTVATVINGRVTDEKNEGLAYATIFLKNTSIGTTSNGEGYYSIDAPKGDYEIVFQYIGFKKYSQKISVEDKTITLNVSLEEESIELNEVVVNSGGEDPAYAIIRHAQEMRKHYLTQVDAYSCNVYIKGMQGLDEIPEKIFGVKAKKLDVDSSLLGIVYLSESESQYNYQRPDKVKEIVYSSKVSGDNNAFTWNSASAFSSNFYENIIPLEGITARGLISPIAEGAFTFYKYHLLGTIYEDGLVINKIQVMAKRATDPSFNGTIYIVDDAWAIYSLNLLVTKEAHLDFIDSLRFIETYGRVNDTAWMPFNQVLQFKLSAFGFSGNGKFLGIFSKYDLDPKFSKDFFDAEELKVANDANKKDSSYWEQNRPVPLTADEKVDYYRKDSIHTLHTSKEYLDSVDRKENKFKIEDALLGYSYANSYHKLYYQWSNPLLGISYNTVEGFNLTLRNSLRKISEDESTSWRLGADLRYGFSNQQLSFKTFFRYRDDAVHHQVWLVGAGIYPLQINREEPISELINALYTLIAQQNFMKLYEKRAVTFRHEREWFNGFNLRSSLSYADRLPLENSTDYSFDWVGDNSFTPNNFFDNPHADSLMRTQALLLDLSGEITIGKKYITRPNGRFSSGSKFPGIDFHYRGGYDIAGSDVNFNLIEGGIGDNFNFGLLGRASLSFSGGTFLSKDSITFIDFKHFQGNQTIIGAHYADGFQLLPYYSYSTNESWLEVHYEQHFGGFFLNKIPLIKKLNIQEVGGVHYLLTPDLHYFEIDAGIEHLFKIIRVDFVTSFSNNAAANWGILIGLNFGNGSIQIE